MSYLVLARKWRPLSFTDLVGQESVVRTLKNALEQGRVAHAYVFSGPRGVGKTTTARILSRALNCQNGPTTMPCGACPSCTAITDGSAVDVVEIDGASNRGINEIRELREAVRYAPSMGKYKVYIIDEVHMLTKEAFNALLKTLEEPPPHVVFIFATTSPKNIPVTVLSRCQHLSFRRIPKARIMDHLAYVCGQEKVTVTQGALEMIARVAEGSVRDSLTVLDQAMAFSTEIREEDLQAMLGLPERGLLYDVAGLLVRGDRNGLLEKIAGLADAGHDLRTFPRELVSLFRNLMVVKIAERPATLLELPEDEILDLQALAEEATVEELTLMMNELMNLEAQIRSVTTPRYLLELSFVRASFLKGSTSIEGLIAALSDSGPGGTGAAPPAGSPPASAPAKPHAHPRAGHETPKRQADPPSTAVAPGAAPRGAAEPETPYAPSPSGAAPVAFTWDDVVRHVERNNHPLSSRLAKGRIDHLNDHEVRVVFETENPDFFISSLKRSLADVEQAVAEVAGRKLRVNLVAAEAGPGTRPANLKAEITKEPIVQAAIEIFDAKVMDVRPLDNSDDNGGS